MENKKYIGISEDRLHHIVAVSRKAYQIAKDRGHSEEFARKCFMMGWIHDVGYEFSEDKDEHPEISVELFKLLIDNSVSCDNLKSIEAIRKHGLYVSNNSEEWVILNQADLQVSPNGKNISVSDRLEDIKKRFGEWSNTYLTACDIAYSCGLTSINLAGMS